MDILTFFFFCVLFFFSSRRRHTRCSRDWSSDVCSSDLGEWVKRPGLVRSNYTVAIYNALRAADITIPFPQPDLHLAAEQHIRTG